MADPVVGLTNGVPTSGTGTITTLGQTLVDGANATHGITTGAAVVTDVAGTFQQYLRGLVKLWASLTFKAASTAPAATDPALVVAVSPNSWDVSSGTGGTKTQRVIMDSSQLAALATTAQAMSAGFQAVALPTDQLVPNKLQSQSNGTTSSRVDAAATTNATSLKASAGAGVNIDVFNVAAYDVFLKFYNKASAPTVGTDIPVWTIPVKAGTGYARTFLMGKWFSTGIAYAITKLQADTDTTAVALHDLTGSIDWI